MAGAKQPTRAGRPVPPEKWRAAGGFVVGDRVCWFTHGRHHAATVRLIGRKAHHAISVVWDDVRTTTANGKRIYPHVLVLLAECPKHPGEGEGFWTALAKVKFEPRVVQPGHLPDCPGCTEPPGGSTYRMMIHKTEVADSASSATAKPPRCFACDGSGTRCNRCGEAESACGCEEGFEPADCSDCKGTGR